MKTMRRIAWLISLACMVAVPVFCQAKGNQRLNVRVDKSTVIRIFYLPPESYLHPALIFRVARENDPRLGTAPISLLGRTPYISLSEMRNLAAALADWDLSWQKSKKLETPKKIETREMTDKMEVKMFSSSGTDRVLVDPKQLCERLAPLDAALKQPRALWEFQLFRVDYGCHVQGFDRNAFPEHDEPKAATQR
jgi:hypothetical protein